MPIKVHASTLVVMAALGVGSAGLMLQARQFASRELRVMAQQSPAIDRPRIVGVRPGDGSRELLPNVSVALDLKFPPSASAAGVDVRSLDAGVRLTDASGRAVAAHINTTGAGDAIVLVPETPLAAGMSYTLETNDRLLDNQGRSFEPFRSRFQISSTVRTTRLEVAFEKVALPGVESGSAFTAVTVGPDGSLFAGTFDGRILQYAINADGTLSPLRTIASVIAGNGGPRMVIGLAFDPRAPRDRPQLWVSHGQMAPFVDGAISGADDWTGKISRLTGDGFGEYRDVVINLPRAYKDHLNFQPAFGPDGALYFNQGSHTGVGAPEAKWGMRPERLMTAAILRLDPAAVGQTPIDARTTDDGGTYQLGRSGAPLTVHATGVRCSYDLLWHTNGRLYASINGASAGGSTPGAEPRGDRTGIRPMNELAHTSDDVLVDVRQGGYYGAPNPVRGEIVLNGGNPTPGVDPYEVPQYPVGTLPEPAWRRPIFSFGKNVSPNGMIEYRGPRFGGALEGAILVTRFSGGDDVVALRIGADGRVAEEVVGIRGLTGFTDPLDLAQDPRTGNLYVAEFGGQRLTLLRPVAGSSEVYLRPAE